MNVEPMPGVVLVELPTSDLGNIPVQTPEHESLMSGIIRMVNKQDDQYYYLVGRTAYWGRFKDIAKVKTSAERLGFIEIADIKGTSHASTNT